MRGGPAGRREAEQADAEHDPAGAAHARGSAACGGRRLAGTSARNAAAAQTAAATSKVKRKAGRKPSTPAREPKSQAELWTPTTTPSVRERKAKPPAAPCWRAGKAAIP